MSVTATNFQDAPHSAWGFHHVPELLDTAVVARGTGPVWQLPRAGGGLDDLPVVLADGSTARLAELDAAPDVDGIAVLHRGVLVHEAYGNCMRPGESHILMSTTKSFTGTLAGILIDAGALVETDRVTDVLPGLKGTAYDGATVRHLLDMRVGLDFSEDYDDPECDFAYMDAACCWRPPIRPGAPDNLQDFIATMRARPPHGGPFHYVSPNAVVLGWVLEAAAGEPLAALLSRLVWQPMGAEFDAHLVRDRRGASQTEGGLNVALRDLARFGELHRLGGVVGGRRIVPESWIADLRSGGDRAAWDAGTMAALMPHHSYRSKWYIDHGHPHRPIFTAGAFGQSVFVDPVAQVVVARLSCFSGDEGPRFDEMFRTFHAIAHALHGG